jgi:hypothetical protein
VQPFTTGTKNMVRSIRSRLSRFLANLSRAIDGSPDRRQPGCFGVRSATIRPGADGPTSYTVMLHGLSSSGSTPELGTARFWDSGGHLRLCVAGWTFRVVSFTGVDATSKSQPSDSRQPASADGFPHISRDGNKWMAEWGEVPEWKL